MFGSGSSSAPVDNELVLQLLGFKVITNLPDGARYRLEVSDGVNSFNQATLATSLNGLFETNGLRELIIFQLKRYTVTEMQDW